MILAPSSDIWTPYGDSDARATPVTNNVTLRTPWTRQPTVYTPANTKWLDKGLRILVNAAQDISSHGGLALTRKNPSPAGNAMAYSAAANEAVIAADNRLPASTDELTLMMWGYCVAPYNNTNEVYAIGAGEITGITHEAFTTGRLLFRAYYYPDYTGSSDAYTTTAITANTKYVVIARYKRNTFSELYINGTLAGSNTPGDYPLGLRSLSNNQFQIQVGSQERSIRMHGGALFLKAISAQDIADLTKNPWQLFAPIERRIYIPKTDTQPEPSTKKYFKLGSFKDIQTKETTTDKVLREEARFLWKAGQHDGQNLAFRKSILYHQETVQLESTPYGQYRKYARDAYNNRQTEILLPGNLGFQYNRTILIVGKNNSAQSNFRTIISMGETYGVNWNASSQIGFYKASSNLGYSSNSVAVGEYFVAVLRSKDGGINSVYLNGVYTNTQDPGQGELRDIISFGGVNGNGATNMSIKCIGAWSRYISDVEVEYLAKNYDRLFNFDKKIVYVNTGPDVVENKTNYVNSYYRDNNCSDSDSDIVNPRWLDRLNFLWSPSQFYKDIVGGKDLSHNTVRRAKVAGKSAAAYTRSDYNGFYTTVTGVQNINIIPSTLIVAGNLRSITGSRLIRCTDDSEGILLTGGGVFQIFKSSSTWDSSNTVTSGPFICVMSTQNLVENWICLNGIVTQYTDSGYGNWGGVSYIGGAPGWGALDVDITLVAQIKGRTSIGERLSLSRNPWQLFSKKFIYDANIFPKTNIQPEPSTKKYFNIGKVPTNQKADLTTVIDPKVVFALNPAAGPIDLATKLPLNSIASRKFGSTITHVGSGNTNYSNKYRNIGNRNKLILFGEQNITDVSGAQGWLVKVKNSYGWYAGFSDSGTNSTTVGIGGYWTGVNVFSQVFLNLPKNIPVRFAICIDDINSLYAIYINGNLMSSGSLASNLDPSPNTTPPQVIYTGTINGGVSLLAIAEGYDLSKAKSYSINPWQIFEKEYIEVSIPNLAQSIAEAVTEVTVFRPSADVTTTGWTGTPDNTDLYLNINEAIASDTEYVTSPGLDGTGSSITFNLDYAIPAGIWGIKVKARKAGWIGKLSASLLASDDSVLDTTSWVSLTDEFVLYDLPVTIGQEASKIRITVKE